jgi:aminobutyraldehyde dehydrogenase
MAGAARTLQTPAPHEYLAGQLSLLIREPLGVIGAVTPWNYPLMTASWKIAPALAMGNTMVLKPSELTPLSTLRFVELVDDILPPGVLNVVLGTGPEVGAALSQHPDVDMITLTGSVGSGSQVMIDAAPTLKPVHLELGGKAPVVVFSDADLPKVVAAVRMAAFVNTGQECGAATRVLCEESVRDELTRLLVEAVSTIRTGGPEEGPEVEMGPLVSEAHRGRVAAMVERARAAGATVAIGGTPLDREGFFYTPTVITDAPTGSEILTEEIFGPVVTIESFETESEAIASANATRYGLAGSVWTENLRRAMRVTTALDFGTIWANNHLALTPEMPWGGFGNSGHGRECSTLALEDFSRTKHIMITTTQD